MALILGARAPSVPHIQYLTTNSTASYKHTSYGCLYTKCEIFMIVRSRVTIPYTKGRTVIQMDQMQREMWPVVLTGESCEENKPVLCLLYGNFLHFMAI